MKADTVRTPSTVINTVAMGKLEYLLSSCEQVNDEFFTKLVQVYEAPKVACMKYYFHYAMTLDIDEAHTEFVFKRIDYHFMAYNAYNTSILDSMNTLSPSDTATIKAAYSTLTNGKRGHGLHVIPNLLEMYSGYKHIVIPIILDYSQDYGLTHQCCILVDTQRGLFMFYEPYGSYFKYGYRYVEPIQRFLDIYVDVLPSKYLATTNGTRHVNLQTFHAVFDIKEGIQNMMLRINNSRVSSFLQEFDEFVVTLSPTERDRVEQLIKRDTNPVRAVDKTVDCLHLIEALKGHTDKDVQNKAFDIYARYNSKTCVSITLVELHHLFEGTLSSMYTDYTDQTQPNDVFMRHLQQLLMLIMPRLEGHLVTNTVANICNNILRLL